MSYALTRVTRRLGGTPFLAYLSSTSLWVGGISLQNLLVSWIMIGELNASAILFGEMRALMTIPPLILVLVGGFWADRVNAKKLLFSLTLLATAAPVVLAFYSHAITLPLVVMFGLGLALINALGDPARQALVNEVAPLDIQRSIVLITIFPMFVSMLAMSSGYQLENLGLFWVFLILAGIFAVATIALLGIPNPKVVRRLASSSLLSDFRVTKTLPFVSTLIGMNFVSATFNAGAYMVAIPLIATHVYGGGPEFFSVVLIVFTVGSTGSNVLLFFLMPFNQPGKIYLSLQITRALILVALCFEPPQWVFLLCVFLWGLNMGVSSTIIRSTVQEMAPPEHRAKVLSIFLFAFMVASPISSLILGAVIEIFGPLAGLLPGIPISLALFLFGYLKSGYWTFVSPSVSGQNIARM